jgi:hypothetical protein
MVKVQLAAKCLDRASIAVLVASGLRLDRHRTVHSLQRRYINTLSPRADRRNLCDRLAAAGDTNRRAGSSALDQLTQMRLCIREIDRYHATS